VGQKIGPQTHGQNSVKSEAIKKIFTERFLGKFVVKWILKTHHFFHVLLHYLVKHECQQNKPLKHKLQGSVATYLRCGRVVNNKIKNKDKVFPYSLPSVGPGADPGVQAVSPQVT